MIDKSEFRVDEYDGEFSIARKKVTEVITGMLWLRKTKKETTWHYIDKYGRYIVSANFDHKLKPFKDLESALNMIDIISIGVIKHYPDFTEIDL
jgi:hypothetical protein